MMKALILIGGQGTRLRPLTYSTLKCMVPIVNTHFIVHQLLMLKKYGIKDIVLSVCYLPEKIKKVIGSGKKYGLRIKYVEEKKPLGTAGAIKNSEKYLKGTTIVMNGDILSDINLKKLISAHKKKKAVATIALHEVKNPAAYGLVETKKNGLVARFLEKPKKSRITTKWINAGLYVFDKRVLSYIPKNKKFSLEREVFPGLLKSNERVAGFKSKSYWLDIGKTEKYMQANFDILEKKFKFPVKHEKKLKSNVMVGKKTIVDKKAVLKGPVLFGDNCKIGKGRYNPLVITGDRCIIEDKVKIEKAILWDNIKVEKNVTIKNSIIGNNCRIKKGSVLNGVVLGDGNRAMKNKRKRKR